MVFESAAGAYVVKKVDMLIDETLKNSFNALMQNILKDKWSHKAKAGNALISKILANEDIYNDFIKSHVMENLYFKTIDGKNKNIFIDDIFIESEVELTGEQETLNLKQIIELTKNDAVNIEGIAGQGKSTLIRKILLESINLRSHLPIFIELRKLKDGSTILSEIIKIFENSGLNANIENTESALLSKRILLLLDGYDELKSADREKVYNEIEDFKLRLRVPLIVTSRPDTAICNSTLVKNLKIKNLSREKTLNIIKKRMDLDTYEKSKEALENNERLFDSLITPILVSLFCASYPESDFIPKTASDYYSRIFNILYDGHDKRKLFYDREKKLSIPTDLAKNAFTALCFLCFSSSKLSFSKDEILPYIKNSLSKVGKKNDLKEREDYLEDLLKVTGLIKADGYDNYSFIHKSIMEYHAAVYIKNAEKKSDYQNKICAELLNCNLSFIGLVEFLYDIDRESTLRFISMPLFDHFGFNNKKDASDDSDIKYAILSHIINETRFAIVFYQERSMKENGNNIKEQVFISKLEKFRELSASFNIFIDCNSDNILSFNELAQSILFKEYHRRQYIANSNLNPISSHDTPLNEENSVSVKDLINDMNLHDEFMEGLDPTIAKLTKAYNEHKKTLQIISESENYFSL